METISIVLLALFAIAIVFGVLRSRWDQRNEGARKGRSRN